MKTRKRIIAVLAVMAMLTTGCQPKENPEAKALLERARTEYGEGRYSEALATIEQLRRDHPQAIDERRQALTLFQDVALKQAQTDLARTDSLLEAMKLRYEQRQTRIKTSPYSKQLEGELTETRRLRDSLQVRFDTQCAKIKYIHKKQKEG